jgi:hypothetical protein
MLYDTTKVQRKKKQTKSQLAQEFSVFKMNIYQKGKEKDGVV